MPGTTPTVPPAGTQPGGAPPRDPPAVRRAIEEYLTYLRVERGLSPATLLAYGSDLADFADARGTAAEWAHGPEAAVPRASAKSARSLP